MAVDLRNPNDIADDGFAPYLQGRKPLSTDLAQMSPSGAQMPDSAWLPGDKDSNWMDPDSTPRNAFQVGGVSSQPEQNKSVDVSAGAGNVMNRPPAATAPPGDQSQYAPPAKMAPPAPTAAPLPPGETSKTLAAPFGVGTPTPQPVSAEDQAIVDRMSARKPPTPSTGPQAWAQRLGMAVLAATKLAPYAQQIIHPQYSQQMGAYEAANTQDQALLKARETAENTAGQAELRAGTAEWRQAMAAKAASDAAEKQRADQAAEDVKRVANFTRMLGKPDEIVEGLDSKDPAGQQQIQQHLTLNLSFLLKK